MIHGRMRCVAQSFGPWQATRACDEPKTCVVAGGVAWWKKLQYPPSSSRQCTVKSSCSTRPITSGWVEMPTSDTATTVRSRIERGARAEISASGTAIRISTIAPPRITDAVTPAASRTI